MFSRPIAGFLAACLLPGCLSFSTLLAQSAPAAGKRPVAYANALVGTAPLDDPKLIGNAPPAGERLYSGITSPGAILPHSSTDLAPINNNIDLTYPAGVPTSYYYPNRTMIGFTTGYQGGPTVMPAVGDFTVPPDRISSVYEKAREKASPGYYSVYLDDFKTRVEMTVTTWTGLFRFTFPATHKANVLLDLGRAGGDIEVVGDHTVRGVSHWSRRRGRAVDMYFVAEFSRPFSSFGTFKQFPATEGEMRAPLLGDKDVEPDTRTLSGVSGAIADVSVTLNLSGGWNGDLYAYVVHNDGFAVLLNRVGRGTANPPGYGDSGMSVVFNEAAAGGDIHWYGGMGEPVGNYLPDGRYILPKSEVGVFDVTTRTALLSSFVGLDPNGKWTLFVADASGGDQSTVTKWGLAIRLASVPEPASLVEGTLAALFLGGAIVLYRLKRPRQA